MPSERNRPDLADGFPAGIGRTDALLDEALRETFLASDPIAISAPEEQAMPSAERTPAQAAISGGESVAVE